MSALGPNDLAALLADIVDTIASGVTVGEGRAVIDGGTYHHESLDRAYRWFHGAAYSGRVGGGGSAQLCPQCSGFGVYTNEAGRWVRCEACTPRAGHDPTGDAVVSQRELQAKVAEVSWAVTCARVELNRALASLRACEAIVDRGVDRTLANDRVIPRTASRAEIDLAHAAQARRLERGEMT